ncbi:MAG: hypothetical protein LBQ58_02640 [Synergistaceae bacterium]|nr:hypothetical protein [Synergistaceae bacterium]
MEALIKLVKLHFVVCERAYNLSFNLYPFRRLTINRYVLIFLVLIAIIFGTITALSSLCAGAAYAGSVDVALYGKYDDRTRDEAAAFLGDAERELGLQTKLESPNESDEEGLPDETDEESFIWSLLTSDITQVVARYLLYAALIAIVTALLSSIRRNPWSRSRARAMERRDAEENISSVAVTRMELAQTEADERARQGDFGAAMHILLLQSVNELRARAHISISDSLTSREILRRITSSSECRAAFADIVGCVEVSYFGTHQPDAEEYYACRRSFDTLTELIREGAIA